MTPHHKTLNRLRQLIEPVCRSAGYELVEVEYRREQRGWVLRVYIDVEASGHVGFADCERVSRELSPLLDVEDPIPQEYHLEVSSPGVDRPLRTRDHFRRYIGEVAKITMREGIDGRRNFKGTLVSVSDANNGAVVVEVDGVEVALPLDDLDRANLVPNWDQGGKQSSHSRARAVGGTGSM